jgi:hypothetical protein
MDMTQTMEVSMPTTMFNKRHYEAIAAVMQETKSYLHGVPNQEAQWDFTRTRLSLMFARDNVQFKRARFEAACEPGANVRART